MFRDGEKKEVIVKKVGISSVEYIRYDNQGGPVYEVPKGDLFMIEYENGVNDYFELTKETSITDIREANKGVFIDLRDSISYSYIKIGNQIWMNENLNYDDGKGPCTINTNMKCDKCGVYYSYEDALTICPDGWHLPSDEEWMELEIEVGMNEAESRKFGWRGTPPGQAPTLLFKGNSGVDLRMCGYGFKTNFSKKNPKYTISYLGEQAYYWTSSECSYLNGTSYTRHFKGRASIERIDKPKNSLLPVRCVKND